MSADGELLKSYSTKKKISAVFKTCTPLYPDTCRKVISFLSALKQRRKNIQYLTSEEVQKVRNALNDDASPPSLRDRAMGKFAVYTGLHSSDIANMEISSVDWDGDLIRITQQKTGVPLELPLSAVVGNAIYDYISLERSATEVHISSCQRKDRMAD